MKNNYYKINLVGSTFWRSKDCVYTKREYVSDNSLLDDVFFKKISNDTYEEILTNKRVVIDPSNTTSFAYPEGVIIDTSKLIPSSSKELIERFDQIKKHNLNKDYMKLLVELLQNSHYCELASKKKEESMKRIKRY